MTLRWHTHPELCHSGDTVDAHSRRVADLCVSLAARIGHRLDGSDLLTAALHHDDAEAVLGDMPYTAKARFPKLAAAYAEAERLVLAEMGLHWTLTEREDRMLRLCDRCDAWRWAHVHGRAEGPEWQQMRRVILHMAAGLDAVAWAEEVIDGRGLI